MHRVPLFPSTIVTFILSPPYHSFTVRMVFGIILVSRFLRGFFFSKLSWTVYRLMMCHCNNDKMTTPMLGHHFAECSIGPCPPPTEYAMWRSCNNVKEVELLGALVVHHELRGDTLRRHFHTTIAALLYWLTLGQCALHDDCRPPSYP